MLYEKEPTYVGVAKPTWDLLRKIMCKKETYVLYVPYEEERKLAQFVPFSLSSKNEGRILPLHCTWT